MIPSKHNIVSKIDGTDQYFVVNLLSGQADLLDSEDATLLLTEGTAPAEGLLSSELAEKGYLVEAGQEQRSYRNRYFDFVDNRDQDEVQLFFVPNYSCNFQCSYCYQDEYTNPLQSASEEVIDAFFAFVRKQFAGRKKYLTLFGGEPLLNSERQRHLVARLIDRSNEAGLSVCVVTNGYHLRDYIPVLSKGSIREIQVTLDGTQGIHDGRRSLKNGSPTFEKIVEGIDAALEVGFPINLRMVIDKRNVENLAELATFAIGKGWTSHPLFKTQIGRNYELHHCQSTPDQLFTRVTLYRKIYELIQQHPHIEAFYKPSYSISKYLAEHGELPDPLFDACPACKTEWAFDYTGHIYSCTATVGKREESLGTFYPEIHLKEEAIGEWSQRDVTTIPACAECTLQLACGGGCGSVAKNRTGSVLTPDCRPVKELLEIGFKAYFDAEGERQSSEPAGCCC